MSEFYRDKWFKEILNTWIYKKNIEGITEYWYFTKYFIAPFSSWNEGKEPKYPHIKGYYIEMRNGILSKIRYTNGSYIEIDLIARFQELKDEKKLRLLNSKLAKSLLHPESVKDSQIELSAKPKEY